MQLLKYELLGTNYFFLKYAIIFTWTLAKEKNCFHWNCDIEIIDWVKLTTHFLITRCVHVSNTNFIWLKLCKRIQGKVENYLHCHRLSQLRANRQLLSDIGRRTSKNWKRNHHHRLPKESRGLETEGLALEVVRKGMWTWIAKFRKVKRKCLSKTKKNFHVVIYKNFQ